MPPPPERERRLTRRDPWSVRRVFAATLVVLSVAFAGFFVYRFGAVFFGLFIAIVIATALRPAVRRLTRIGLPPRASAAVAYVALLLCAAGLVVLLLPPAVDQLSRVASQLPDYYARLREGLMASPSRLLAHVGRLLPASWSEAPPPGATRDLASGVLGLAESVAWNTVAAIAVLLLGFYWLIDGEAIVRGVVRLVPTRRGWLRELAAAAEEKLGGYVRGQVLVCAAVGTLAFVAYAAIGLPYALLLALAAGLFEAVPILGPWLGAVPAVFVAFSTEPVLVLWVLAATAVIQVLENYVLLPRIMRHAVGVNGMVSLLAILAFGSVFGVPGALLAIPLAAVLQLVFRAVVPLVRASGEAPLAASGEQTPSRADAEAETLDDLRTEARTLLAEARALRRRERLTRRTAVQSKTAARLTSIARDLTHLLAHASEPNGGHGPPAKARSK